MSLTLQELESHLWNCAALKAALTAARTAEERLREVLTTGGWLA
jgi:hypothetical protein